MKRLSSTNKYLDSESKLIVSIEEETQPEKEWEEDNAGFIPRKTTVSYTYTESDFEF